MQVENIAFTFRSLSKLTEKTRKELREFKKTPLSEIKKFEDVAKTCFEQNNPTFLENKLIDSFFRQFLRQTTFRKNPSEVLEMLSNYDKK